MHTHTYIYTLYTYMCTYTHKYIYVWHGHLMLKIVLFSKDSNLTGGPVLLLPKCGNLHLQPTLFTAALHCLQGAPSASGQVFSSLQCGHLPRSHCIQCCTLNPTVHMKGQYFHLFSQMKWLRWSVLHVQSDMELSHQF